MDCWARANGGDQGEKVAEKVDELDAATQGLATVQEEVVEDAAVGADTAGTSLSSNKKGLLPLLAFSGLLGEPAQDDENEDLLVFDLNFLVPGNQGGKNAQFKAIVNTNPTLSTGWSEQLPEEGRDDQVAALEKDLPDTSDVGFAFTYARKGLNYGRDFSEYRGRFERLWRAARSKERRELDFGETQLIAVNERLQVIKCNDTNVGELLTDGFLAASLKDIEELVFQNLLCRPLIEDGDEPQGEANNEEARTARTKALAEEAAKRKEANTIALEVQNLVQQAIELESIGVEKLNSVFDNAGLDLFGKLVDNQPQLFVEAKRKVRDELVGAEETAISVNYEWASTNLKKSMPQNCHESLERDTSLEESALPSPSELVCLQQYREFSEAHRDAIDTANRFKASLEYADVDDLSLSPTALGLEGDDPIAIKGTEKLIVSIGWSRYFNVGAEPASMDLVANYEDVSDDPNRNNRATASLTFTRKVGGLTIPFGIVWANKGEYLGDVDEKLSAHLGLRFDLFGKQDSK